MLYDALAQDLYTEICRIPLIDTHTHIDPHQPTARGLDDILSCHYYTEMAHSAGMDKTLLLPQVDPQERVRAILYYITQFDNTAQYQWFVEITRAFLNYQDTSPSLDDCDWLTQTAAQVMTQPDWASRVLRQTNVEKIFLTNDFDDPLTGFDAHLYIPCLNADDLVFRLDQPAIHQRLAQATGIEVGDTSGLRRAIAVLFEHFNRHGARGCTLALLPGFSPVQVTEQELTRALRVQTGTARDKVLRSNNEHFRTISSGVFWMLVEYCCDFSLPIHLRIGVHREGVDLSQDLLDQRASLVQYAELFNAFPTVFFCVSVLSSWQNQELASCGWIFPNVITSGHWWYSDVPVYIEQDSRARLQTVPKSKQIGYFSNSFKLEFILPKFNMYRRILAEILANDFLRPRIYTERQVIELARFLLNGNAQRIFNL